MQEDEISYCLTESGLDTAKKILAGVPPSDLGYDLGMAAVILYLYGRTVNDEDAIELAKTYSEAHQAINPEEGEQSV